MNKLTLSISFFLVLISSVLFGELSCGFLVDLSEPYITGGVFPPDGVVLDSTDFELSFDVDDILAGVWLDSLQTTLVVNGFDSLVYFGLTNIPCSFEGGYNVQACIHVPDMIFDTLYCTCPPNYLDYCWSFDIEEPCSSWIDTSWMVEETDCNDSNLVEICYHLSSTCELPLALEIYPRMSSDGGSSWSVPLLTLYDTPGNLGAISDTGWHCFTWDMSDDLFAHEGCDFVLILESDSITHPAIMNGCLDSDPPEVTIECPDSIVFGGTEIEFNWNIDDRFEGDNFSRIRIFNSACGIDTTIFVADTFASWIVPGYECSYCNLIVSYSDSFCNIGFDTCIFNIEVGEMSAEVLEPIDINGDGRIVSNCEDQQIRWLINHDYPLIEDSIYVEICGIGYNLSDSHLWLSGDTLVWDPLTDLLWEANDSCEFCMISAEDNSGASLLSPVCRDFIVDLLPPVIIDITPIPSSIVYSHVANIEYNAFDSICDSSIIYDSLTITSTLSGVDITEYSINGAHVGGLLNTDTLNICAYFSDHCSDYCNVNSSDSCWYLAVITCDIAPVVEIVYPESCGYITSCDDQEVSWIVTDTGVYDIVDSTFMVRIQISGPSGAIDTILGMGSGALNWVGDSLTFDPESISMFYSSWDTVTVTLVECFNSGGCPLTSPVSCSFIVDLDPPVLTGFFDPPPGEYYYTDSVTLTLDIGLYDSISGFYTDGISIERFRADSGFGPMYFSGGISVMLPGAIDEDSVRICALNIRDNPDYDYCPANTIGDTCWWIYFAIGEGPNVTLVEPVERYGDTASITSACECQPVIMEVNSTDGIVDSSILFRVEGIEYDIDSPELELIGDSLLVFTPSPPCWEDSQIVDFILLEMMDTLGVPISSVVSGYFIADYLKPYMGTSYPIGGAMVSGPWHDFVYAYFGDNYSAVYFDSIMAMIICEGDTLFAGHVEDTIPGSDTLDLTGLITVCYNNVMDYPDYCHNVLDTCFSFTVSLDTLRAEYIYPDDRDSDGTTVTACECSPIKWTIESSEGLIAESTLVEVDGITYNWTSGAISASWDTLIWNVDSSICFADSDLIECMIMSLVDSSGNRLDSIANGQFLVDISSPYIEYFDPEPFSWITDPTIELLISDSVYLVNRDSFAFSENGIDISPGSSSLIWRADTLTYSPTAGYDWGDTIDICFEFEDIVDHCEANVLDTCWSFIVWDSIEVISEMLFPDIDSAYSACPSQQVIWTVFDTMIGLDPNMIWVSDNGLVYDTTSPALEYDNDTLIYTLSGLVPEGWHHICLDSAFDFHSNPIEVPLCVELYMDFTPPEIVFENPICSTTVHDSLEPIIIRFSDSGAGVDWASSWISVDSDTFLGLSVSGDSMFLDPALWGLSWSDGDTILICGYSIDNPDFCYGVNEAYECCEFYVEISELWAEAIEPPMGIISSCSLQAAAWLFHGLIVEDSIMVELNDTSAFDISSSELSLTGDTLLFTPSMNWHDGDSVELCLIDASDSFYVHITDTVCVEFYIDRQAPAFSDIQPVMYSSIDSLSPEISLVITDNLAGVDWSSVTMIVEGNSVDITIVGDTIDFATADSGWSWLAGDTIDICVYGSDLAQLCGANTVSLCWEIYINVGEGPIIEAVYPSSDSLWSACLDQGAIFTIIDSNGIDSSSILVTVNDDTSDTWAFCDDTLEFATTILWEDLDTITICVWAQDSRGNPTTDWECITFLIDLSPPVVDNIDPIPGVISSLGDIYIELFDSGCGILDSSLTISVGDSIYNLDHSHLSWDGNELSLDSSLQFEAGDTIIVCLDSITDNPDLCLPNSMDTCWTYIIELLPDLWTADSLVSLIPAILEQGEYSVFDAIGYIDDSYQIDNFQWAITIGEIIIYSNYLGLPADSLVCNLTLDDEILGLDGGDYLVCLEMDIDNDITESDESNNIGCVTMRIIEAQCDAHPNPFSPNFDDINDLAKFTFPGMGNDDFSISIFDMRGTEVLKINSFDGTHGYIWDGKDSQGNLSPKGVYLYIVEVEGEIVCKGTIHLAR